MNELRKQFEALPEIEERILLNSMKFCEKGNLYYTEVGSYISAAWVTGAWYAFQEQQKIIDNLKNGLTDIWTNLDDRQSKEWIIEHCENIIKELLK